MATTPGDEDDLDTLLEHLIALDYDAIEACERAVAKPVASPEVKRALEENLADERKHRKWLEQAIAKQKPGAEATAKHGAS